MRLVTLGSGSRGNATLVELGGKRLLVDAGLSAKELACRLEAAGADPAKIDGVLLSHEHVDHTRGVDRFSRKHGVPVFCSVDTLEAMDRSPVHFASWHPLAQGECLDLGTVTVEPFPVPHDAVRPVGFVLRAEGLQVGIATDLGHVTAEVVERLRGCDVLMIESNHDDRMLMEGPYPWHLKRRVSGMYGHLSNREAAAVLLDTVRAGCRAVVLAHLSEKNNTPELARRAADAALGAARMEVQLRVAGEGLGAPLHV